MAVLVIKSLDEIRQIAIENLTEGTVLSVEYVGKDGPGAAAAYDLVSRSFSKAKTGSSSSSVEKVFGKHGEHEL